MKILDAYELLVDGQADTQGKLAFALFMRARSESLLEIEVVLSNHERQVFRSAASSELDSLRELTVEDLYSDVQLEIEGSMVGRIDASVADLKRSTSWHNTILFNLIAWLLSIGLTVLIYEAVQTPSVVDTIGVRVDGQ